MNKYKDVDKNNIVMVGDRKYDIVSANKIGISSLGVLYVYGDLKEIQESEPNYIAESVEKLEKILLD